jgi:hypothetical protein
MDGSLPIGVRDGATLIVGDRDERHVSVFVEQRSDVVRVKHPVKGRDSRAFVAPHQREMQIVAVEVDDVEATNVSKYELHHANVLRKRFAHVRVSPQRARTSGNQTSARFRIGAGE